MPAEGQPALRRGGRVGAQAATPWPGPALTPSCPPFLSGEPEVQGPLASSRQTGAGLHILLGVGGISILSVLTGNSPAWLVLNAPAVRHLSPAIEAALQSHSLSLCGEVVTHLI